MVLSRVIKCHTIGPIRDYGIRAVIIAISISIVHNLVVHPFRLRNCSHNLASRFLLLKSLLFFTFVLDYFCILLSNGFVFNLGQFFRYLVCFNF